MKPAPPVTRALTGRGSLTTRRADAATRSQSLRAAVHAARRGARRRRAGARRRRWSARRAPSWATTRPTPRCCWRRCAASSRGRSPSGCASRSPRRSAGAPSGSRSPGPGSSTCFLTDRWHREAVAAILERRRATTGRVRRPARAGPGRVRLRQPDRPADRGRRPGRRLRRLARAAARGGRARGRARVPAQRRRRPGRALRRLDRRADARRAEPPEDGYEGEYVERAGGRAGAPRAWTRTTSTRSPRRGTEAMRERIAATLERFGVRFDTWFSERVAARGRRDRGGRGRAARARPRLRPRGRGLAAHDRVRRRQGPGADPRRRRADLLRRRHRLPPRQARARLASG